jgi:adenylate cyclase
VGDDIGVKAARILVVDDTPANIRLLEAVLGGNGYEVVPAASGIEALAAVDAGSIDLILLDINMPGMNGHEVCRRIRDGQPGRLLPIVMVTAAADESTATAIDAGADDFIIRPFDQAELLARVRSLLRIKGLHDTVESQSAELATLNRDLQVRVDEQLDELLRLRRLQRFLSPQLADVVVSAGDETLLEPHRREIAVVFCDLRGFTRFAGTAEPEELLDAVRQFHNVLGELVNRHGATVGHFAGDGVMLFFNDPVPCTEPAVRAARLAIELRDAVQPLREAWRRQGHDLGVGVGVSMGFATLGTIGFEGRYDYSAIGVVVNQAARLCDAALPGEVLVAARAFGAMEHAVASEPHPAVDAKGFAEPISAWSVTSIRSELATPAPTEPVRTDVRLLGPLEVVVDGTPVGFAAKERAVLARLFLDPNEIVATDRLIDDLWDGSPPDAAATSLRVHVSRVRKALAAAGADALIVTRAPGYVAQVDPVSIDVARFEALVSIARGHVANGDHANAAAAFRDGLALWRGPALEDVAAAEGVRPTAVRLEELRLDVLEECIDAELTSGQHGTLTSELQELVKAYPLRERLWGQLMLALYRSGRQADALRAFQELRAILADEVGLDPSPAITRLESRILAQDPDLEWTS